MICTQLLWTTGLSPPLQPWVAAVKLSWAGGLLVDLELGAGTGTCLVSQGHRVLGGKVTEGKVQGQTGRG